MKFRKNKNTRSPVLKPATRSLPVNNYYRSPRVQIKKSSIEDQNEARKKNSLKLSTIINFFLVGGAVGLVVFATTLTTTPVIELRKSNAQYYEESVYQQAAQQLLSSNVLNRSKILFQDVSFERQLKDRFPEISSARPLIPLGGRNLTLVITVSEPFAYVSSGSDTGVVNNEGVLVVKNSKSVPEDLFNLRFTEPQSNFEVGSRILTSAEVELLRLLQSEIQTVEFSDASRAEIKEVLFNVSQGQIEARLNGKPFFIRLSTYAEAGVQVGAVKATLRQLDNTNSLPTQYIDVRVPGRAFII
jgi:cell division septal protein FtsQ